MTFSVFLVEDNLSVRDGLLGMLEEVGDVTHPHNPWYVADNLLTYSHTRGFLTEPRFVNAVLQRSPGRPNWHWRGAPIRCAGRTARIRRCLHT